MHIVGSAAITARSALIIACMLGVLATPGRADDQVPETFTYYTGEVQAGEFHCPVEWSASPVDGQPDATLFGCSMESFRLACLERESVVVTCYVLPGIAF